MDNEKRDFLLVLLYLYLQHGKFKKADVVLDVLKAFYPDDLHVIRSAAFVYSETGQSEKALAECNRILSAKDVTKHQQAFAHLLKSKSHWSMGDKTKAEESLIALNKTGEKFE